MYTLGGSFWEFGEPDWEHTRFFMMFGVAEDHDSNPIKIGLAGLRRRGAKFVSVNPVRTGYSAIADEWVGIRPGTDGLFVLALIHELLEADRVDLDYLVRYTNAAWLVIQAPGAADDGLFARNEAGEPLVLEPSGGLASGMEAGVAARLVGDAALPDGRRAVPVFQLVAERYLDPQYAPEAVAETCGVPAATIRRLGAEIAQTAFEEEIELPVPWTDWAGRRHDTMRGRPVSLHAMRGISAHSNGFQTCRALHLLQLLLGTIDVPGGWRYKSPHPKSCPPGPKPTGKPDQVVPGKPLPGIPLGYPMSPEDLILDAEGGPARIDKAFSWEAPIAAHGMMHMVIANASKGDPYPIDTLFMYMANVAWNSAMNSAETMRMLTEKDPATGGYRIPRIIYSDAYYSETVAYADLVLPDTTYLERWDCISLLDRPIGGVDGPGDAIRQPVVEPDRDVRPFQDVLIELGGRLGLPGFVAPDGEPRYPGGYADYIVNHERATGGRAVGRLARRRWRARRPRRAEPAPARALCRQWLLLEAPAARGPALFQARQPGLSRNRGGNGLYRQGRSRSCCSFMSSRLQHFRLSAAGPRRWSCRRRRIASGSPPISTRCRSGTCRSRKPQVDRETFPLHALTQRPMPMYHSWDSQNAWLRQILGDNRLYVNRITGHALGLAEEDWVWVTSHHGRIRVPTRLMDGVNPDTVWTWNAIGKRAGAWNLDPNAPEFRKGFLLNHLISELLPAGGGHRYANADPITGQAAWYDLRVRIERAAPLEAGTSAPAFPPVAHPPSLPRLPRILRYGAQTAIRTLADDLAASAAAGPEKARPRHRPRHLRRAVTPALPPARNGTAADTWGRCRISTPMARSAWGVWFNRIHSFEEGDGEGARTVHFPKSCLHCEEPACVTVCPTGASYKRAEDGIVLVNEALCIGCKLCSWACPYGAREFDADEGVMKKCTLCIDRIYNDNLAEDDRQPACVMVCPVNARHFGDLGDPEFGGVGAGGGARAAPI